jgi:mRNA interferase RelE/StbE
LTAGTQGYRVFETHVFIEDLGAIPEPLRSRIREKLSSYVYPQLKTLPYYGPNIKKLRDWKPETWRYRIGAWRLFYEIHESEKIVYLLTVSPRKDAY